MPTVSKTTPDNEGGARLADPARRHVERNERSESGE